VNLRPCWLFNHNVGKALLWTVLLLALAVTANILGIYLLGSIDDWQIWLDDAAGIFFVWRLCLCAALLAREAGYDARKRLIRAEITAVIAVAALEIRLFMQGRMMTLFATDYSCSLRIVLPASFFIINDILQCIQINFLCVYFAGFNFFRCHFIFNVASPHASLQ